LLFSDGNELEPLQGLPIVSRNRKDKKFGKGIKVIWPDVNDDNTELPSVTDFQEDTNVIRKRKGNEQNETTTKQKKPFVSLKRALGENPPTTSSSSVKDQRNILKSELKFKSRDIFSEQDIMIFVQKIINKNCNYS
jgi:hypothetical protein